MRKLIGLILLYTLVNAQIQLLSPIPLPSNVIVDLDVEEYSQEELEKLLQEGQIFTFLAKSKDINDTELASIRESYMTLFNITQKIYSSETFKVAFIVPYKIIGKYSYTTSNSVLAYLLNRKVPFKMELFPVEDESNSTMQMALDSLSGSTYDLVVAPVTLKGAEYICNQNLNTEIYIPTLHRNRVDCTNDMVSFGGIDYGAQIDLLSRLVEYNATTITVSDASSISKMLSTLVEARVDVNESLVLNRSGYYKDLIERHEDLNQSTIFLNTPVVKSSLFLSQLTLADFKPMQVLSTQINYSPLLLTLTQYHDRENMVLASSIGYLDPILSENISLINQDIRFNWLNYATVVGVDSYFSAKTAEPRVAKEEFVNGSLEYDIKLYEAGLYRFIPKELPTLPEDENITDIYYDDEGVLNESYDTFHSDMSE